MDLAGRAMSGPLVSFCVVTGGRRPEKLERLVRSIRGQNIPRYEIIIAGNPHHIDGVTLLPLVPEAAGGKMGILRNAAARTAGGDLLVSLDDDIILHPTWWAGLSSQGETPPIMTPRILLPDGTRFWDHATSGDSPGGQRILNRDESDPSLYMTGGGGWVMTRDTFRAVQWNDEDEFYKGTGEDTGFSLRARAVGLTPTHNPQCIVYHDDWKYTGFGRKVFIRKILGEERARLRLSIAQALPEGIISHAIGLSKEGSLGDAIDILRLGGSLHPRDPRFTSILSGTEVTMGGPLKETNWFWDGDPKFWGVFRWVESIK
jgi:glycosyltransferase involved in cell wall biosynthesis